MKDNKLHDTLLSMYKFISVSFLFSIILLSGCTHKPPVAKDSPAEEESVCEAIVKNHGDSVDFNLTTHNFAAKIGMYVEEMNKRDLPKTSGKNAKKCAKAKAIQCLLESSDKIDLVRTTPSCHGVSYRETESQTWGNVFVNNKGEG